MTDFELRGVRGCYYFGSFRFWYRVSDVTTTTPRTIGDGTGFRAVLDP